mgnify:CR=1 FL=1
MHSPGYRTALLVLFMVVTANAGFSQAWQFLTPLKTNTEVRGCSFLDGQRGVAVSMVDRIVFRTNNGGDTWEKLWTPAVTANPFDIEWVTEELLFIAASNGDLYRSLDGGNTWANMNPPTSEWLYNVDFISPTVGFATGFNGVILKTIDAGATWNVVPSGTNNRIYDVHFVNADTGFATGWNGTILKTTDAGDNWSLVTTSITASLQDIHFIDELTGFVCGGVIAKTTDGGQTWSTVYSAANSYFYVLHVGSNGQGYAAGNMGVWVKTTNNGQTWQNQTALGNGDVLCGEQEQDGTAYLMGKLQIHKSLNQGSSWTVIKTAAPGGGFNAMQFASDLQGTCVASAGGGTNYGGIAQTSDGGRTWAIRQTATSGGWYAVDFPTAQTGYVLGTNALGKTTNGGLNWTFTTPLTLTPSCLHFLDAQTGFAGGIGGVSNICKTTNGGTSFSCGTNIGATAIHFFDSQRGMAVRGVQSGGDTYYKTFDGGNTWEYHNGLVGLCIHFLNDSIGWVGSYSGAYRTTDGGETWSFHFIGNAPVLAMQFYNPLVGFCVDGNAALHKTLDGGITWEVILQNNTGMFGAGSAAFTENYCYIASGSEIYRTELGCGTFELGNITGEQDMCESVLSQLVCPQVVGAISYQWSLPNGWTGDENDWVIHPVPSAEGGLVQVVVTNACGLQDSTSISVDVTPQVDSILQITGPDVFCVGDTIQYTVPMDENADQFIWQSNFPLLTQASNEALFLATSNQLNLFVRSQNSCGQSNQASRYIIAPDISSNPANFNADCAIDQLDLNLLLLEFGCVGNCGSFDLNADGLVGVGDVVLFLLSVTQ